MSLDALAPQASAAMAGEIEHLGYSALWLPEAWGREAFTNAGLLSSATSSLVIATGIANIWGRDAVSAVNGAKTLTAAYDERFVLGLGVSHEPLVSRLRGHDYQTPFDDDARVPRRDGRGPDVRRRRIHTRGEGLAALGPKMLELAATLADGAHPYLVTPEHTLVARSIVGDKFLGVEQAVVLGHTREEFLRRAHQHLEIYTGLENYRNSWRRLGFGDEDFVRGGSDRLCDALVVHGGEETIRAGVLAHQEAGADHVCLQVLGDEASTPPLEDWRQLSSALGLTP